MPEMELTPNKPQPRAGSVYSGSGSFHLMPNQNEIYVVVEGGVVREVVGLPAKARVVVLDYDIEARELDQIQVSPLDGEACVITTF